MATEKFKNVSTTSNVQFRNGEHLIARCSSRSSSSSVSPPSTMPSSPWNQPYYCAPSFSYFFLLPAILDLPASAFSSHRDSQVDCCVFVMPSPSSNNSHFHISNVAPLSPPAVSSSLRTLLRHLMNRSLGWDGCCAAAKKPIKLRHSNFYDAEGVRQERLSFWSIAIFSFIIHQNSPLLLCNNHRGKWRGCLSRRGHETHQICQ